MSEPPPALGVDNTSRPNVASENDGHQLSPGDASTNNTPGNASACAKEGGVCNGKGNNNEHDGPHDEYGVRAVSSVGTYGATGDHQSTDTVLAAFRHGGSNALQQVQLCLNEDRHNSFSAISNVVEDKQSKLPPQSNPDASNGMTNARDVQSSSVAANPSQSFLGNDVNRITLQRKEVGHAYAGGKVPSAPTLYCVASTQNEGAQMRPPNHHALKRPRPSTLPSDIMDSKLNTRKTTTKITPATKSLSRSSATLRRGKWTAEEEVYVAQVIHDFNAGFLSALAGTTLRSYLSDKLQCDPMRITKKFTGADCIGKRVFHPAVRSSSNAAVIDKAQLELDGLERRWRKRLEIQQKESAKKAATAAASGRHNYSTDGLSANSHGISLSEFHVQNSTIATMAKWLDRANAVLSHDAESLEHNQVVDATEPATANMVEIQLKELEELIGLGPKIQQTFKGLPKFFKESPSLVSIGESSTSSHPGDDPSLSLCEMAKHGRSFTGDGTKVPQAKKPCVAPSSDVRANHASSSADAKDAETLVGFLNSVRSQNHSPDEKPTKLV
uniref:Uncharacterized protein n=1 Tax=Odontella aurita TaxID=265563 RepID=A0A7S4JCB1_9STRA|mmetsp:Transcript_43568/g.132604  ORF Transcript_43568/g.132604 Transcript_43568/m.132604 type:complete len:556 (+) Transcript_43568:353-2020(+)